MIGFLGFWHVNGNEVRSFKQIFQTYQLYSKTGGLFLSYEGVVSNHFHLQGLGSFGHRRSYPAKTYHTQYLFSQLNAQKGLFIPDARLHFHHGLRNIAGQGQHHCNGMFCGGNGIAVRSINHQNPLAGCRLKIYVVHAHTGPANYL